jgi:hypothetical protein
MLVVMLCACGRAIDTRRPDDDRAMTEDRVDMVGVTLVEYRMRTGHFAPTNSDVIESLRVAGLMPAVLSLVEPPFRDEWGSLVQYRLCGDGLLLTSLGEDRLYGTPDDIVRRYAWPADTNKVARWGFWLGKKQPKQRPIPRE